MFRAKAQSERRVREAATTGIVWAGMTAMLIVLGIGAVVGRESVVRIWPKSASAFAAVGLDVNFIGLEIEDIRFEPALQDGHAALSVSGVIRNIRSHPVTAPPLQISLMNKQDKRVMAKIAQAADPVIPAGETRHFAVVLLDPPKTASEIEVGFVTDKGTVVARPKPKHVPAPTPAAPALRGSAEPNPVSAEEAQPLDSHDPNALPTAAAPAKEHH